MGRSSSRSGKGVLTPAEAAALLMLVLVGLGFAVSAWALQSESLLETTEGYWNGTPGAEGRTASGLEREFLEGEVS